MLLLNQTGHHLLFCCFKNDRCEWRPSRSFVKQDCGTCLKSPSLIHFLWYRLSKSQVAYCINGQVSPFLLLLEENKAAEMRMTVPESLWEIRNN